MVQYYKPLNGVSPNLIISTLNVSNTSIFIGGVSVLSNMYISGNTSINGNLEISGSLVIPDVDFTTDILLINSDQIGIPSNTLKSGIEIQRGDLENYQIVYTESDQSLKIGILSSLKTLPLGKTICR